MPDRAELYGGLPSEQVSVEDIVEAAARVAIDDLVS